MKALAVVAVALLLPAGPALAVEAVDCIKLVGPGASLQNSCNRKINLTYCVDNRKSEFDCRRGRGFGAKTLNPGTKEFIPFYMDSGGGRVHWVACFDPQGPREWTGPGDRFVCR